MKTMKLKNIILVMSAAAGLTLSSCDNFTDLSPIDTFTDQSYWRTVSDLELYANGLYGIMSSPNATLDATSDNFVTNTPEQYLFDELNVNSYGNWSWGDIRSCNYFLARYQTAEGSEAEINKYVGEVRFFRSILYYAKIRLFGDVPWYDHDLSTDETDELYKARDPRDFVLGKVIEDLEFAIQWLPAKGEEASGRINKDAARTQLARVCLYFGTYKKYHNEAGSPSAEELLRTAADLTGTMINSGTYEIVKASDAGCGQQHFEAYPLDYSNLFVQNDLTGNKEAILARYYEMGVLTHETGRQVSENGIGLSKDFVESFLMKDGTPIYNAGSGYLGDDDQDLEFAGRDPRIYQIIDNVNKPFTVQGGDIESHIGNVNPNQGVTGYPCVKFRSADPLQAEARATDYDWFVYRYAEVLLIHAEAKAELGECTQAVLDMTVNKLRDRVDMAHLTVNPVADAKPIDYGYALSSLLYEIRRERRIELVAEGFRLDDLKRWNAMKLLENPKTMFGLKVTPAIRERYAEQNVTFSEEGRPTVTYEGAEYLSPYKDRAFNDEGRKWDKGGAGTDRRWLYPLPTQQLQLNTNLTQNPGW